MDLAVHHEGVHQRAAILDDDVVEDLDRPEIGIDRDDRRVGRV